MARSHHLVVALLGASLLSQPAEAARQATSGDGESRNDAVQISSSIGASSSHSAASSSATATASSSSATVSSGRTSRSRRRGREAEGSRSPPVTSDSSDGNDVPELPLPNVLPGVSGALTGAALAPSPEVGAAPTGAGVEAGPAMIELPLRAPPPPPPRMPTAAPPQTPAQAATTPANLVATAASEGVAPLPPARTSTNASASTSDAHPTDHERFLGHTAVTVLNLGNFAVGAFGSDSPDPNASGSLAQAPSIGLRHWFASTGGLGIAAELALGLQLQGTSDGTGPAPSAANLVLHLALPLAVASGRHYALELIPELNLSYFWGGNNDPAANVGTRGYGIAAGVRIGPEITLGYFGIPELSLQPSVGVYLQTTSITTTSSTSGGPSTSTATGGTALNSVNAVSVAALNLFFYF